jgi:hypothetical protein
MHKSGAIRPQSKRKYGLLLKPELRDLKSDTVTISLSRLALDQNVLMKPLQSKDFFNPFIRSGHNK